MTQLDIHPEHLIDRVLRRAANEAERAELALHVRACPGCAAEWRLAQALRESCVESAEPMTAAVDAALVELTRDGRLAPAATLGHAATATATRAWLPWAVALCLFFTGSAAAATLIMAVRSSSSASEPSARASARERAGRSKPSTVARVASADAPAVTDGAAPEVVANTVLAPEPPSVPHARRMPIAPAPKPVQTANELFAQARAAAMQGDYAGAVALYATLEQRFATSPQAHVSQVVLGRLYLEHLADPRAALAHFDAYLIEGGANRPEALLGRARALHALGRQVEEVDTLRQLVGAYPNSLYVVPAQERLRAVK